MKKGNDEMDSEDVYESAWFQVKVREVLCTIVMMHNAIEITSALGEADPFDIDKKGDFRVVKKLYRDIYKPKKMTSVEVDEAVSRALTIYNRGFRP